MSGKNFALQKQQSTSKSSSGLWTKILNADADTTSWKKHEVMTIMHWLKQTIAVLCGVVAGLVPLEGLYGFVFFLASMAVVPIAFSRSVLKIDEDDFGGIQEILFEGATSAAGLFALVWIFLYNVK